MVYTADYGLCKWLTVSFEYLYKVYLDKIFRLCMGYFNDYSLAQDLTQDVFVRVWQYLPTFKGESSVETLIFLFGTNICLRPKERQNSISQTEVPLDMFAKEPSDNSLQVQVLYKAIAELPDMDRLIISLYLEELKQSCLFINWFCILWIWISFFYSFYWGIIAYSILLLWITLNWFVLRPRIIRKRNRKFNEFFDTDVTCNNSTPRDMRENHYAIFSVESVSLKIRSSLHFIGLFYVILRPIKKH